MAKTIALMLLSGLALSGCDKVIGGKYTNSRFGYSFRYGRAWSFEGADTSAMVSVHRARPDPAHPGLNASVTSVTIERIENPKNLSLEMLYAEVNADADRALARAGAPAKQLDPFHFAGRPAVKISTPGLESYKIYVAKADATVLDVSLDILGDENDRSFLAEAQAIVESVRLK